MATLPHAEVYQRWRAESECTVYDYDRHVHLGEEMERVKRLPSHFMLMPPHSWHPDVWADVARMRTLNMQQQQKGRQLHLCPMQEDVARRVIEQLSMPGEVVYDPFVGIGSVAYWAVKLGRVGWGCELSADYVADAARYCQAAESSQPIPMLFDAVVGDQQSCLRCHGEMAWQLTIDGTDEWRCLDGCPPWKG
jgi:DNA modification methylase